MSTTLFDVHWASFSYIWVIPFCIMIMACYVYRNYKIRWAIERLSGKWQSFVIQNFIPVRQYLKIFFFGLALFFLSVALLRPQWHKRIKTIAQEGRDVLIALDISRSMLANDCKPDRLTVAKKKIKQLLSMLQSERVGLILFSGSAFIQCPLTTDYEAFQMFLDHVDAETISSGSTALDAALHKTLEAFATTPDKKNKLLVLFTDGEDFSTNLSQLKQKAQQKNMHIFALGIGTAQGAPIPLYNQDGKQIGHQKDAYDKVVISQLNENLLHALAADVGGVYISLTPDRSDLVQLIGCIKRFEKEQFQNQKVVQFDDTYHYFLLLGLICLLGEWIL